MTRVQYGVNVNTRVPILYPEQYTAADVVALAERVEALGYDGVWVGDNFFAKGRLESIATLSAIAGRTSRVTLGTSALILPLRNTVWFAVSWATLDQLSRGRTIANVCVGGGGAKLGGPLFAAEFDVAGVPYHRRGDVMDEQVLLLRHLWTRPGEPYRGEFHAVPAMALAPSPHQRPAPPIWITNNPQLVEGLGPRVQERMLRRVARLADGWMTALATADEFRGLWDRIVGYARDLGRDPATLTPAYQMTLTVADSRAAAEAEALEFVNRYYGTAYTNIRDSMWGRDPFGTPEHCVSAIRALVRAGVRSMTLRFASRDQVGQVERFTAECLSALRCGE
jgi:alkanesulfonate monooxygenase SsuD/methylene tetrahydromethanopterin reductase-like flavin-dependent oxidoreductase (luciferase family)